METVLAVIVGIGLAASCGFRVFVPLLVSSAAALSGYLELAKGFEWIGTWTALVAFAVAAALEIAAYYIPWLDNLLDTVASPIGVIAGVILFAASVTELDPFLHWSLAIIAGGGSAGIVQGGTVVTRAVSTATTGGLANFAVSTLETLAGFFFSVMSIIVPLIAMVLLLAAVGCMFYVGRQVVRKLVSRRDQASP
jgi:uncharacterized protein DUF4126